MTYEQLLESLLEALNAQYYYTMSAQVSNSA